MTDLKENTQKTVGELLKNARIKQKKEIKTASKKLCIRKIYLEALENDDIKQLPGPAYTIGFLRSYAMYLKLNANSIVKKYQKENPSPVIEKQTKTDDTIPLYKNSKYIYFQYTLYISFVLFIVLAIYGTVSLFSEEEEVLTENQIQEELVLENITPLISEDEIIEPLVLEENETDNVLTKENELTSSKIQDNTNTKIEISKKLIVLLAHEDVWIELKNTKTNQIVFSKTLKKDEKYEMEENNLISLTVGNSGGLSIFVEGKEIKKLGARGFSKSNITMTVEELKKRLPSN